MNKSKKCAWSQPNILFENTLLTQTVINLYQLVVFLLLRLLLKVLVVPLGSFYCFYTFKAHSAIHMEVWGAIFWLIKCQHKKPPVVLLPQQTMEKCPSSMLSLSLISLPPPVFLLSQSLLPKPGTLFLPSLFLICMLSYCPSSTRLYLKASFQHD